MKRSLSSDVSIATSIQHFILKNTRNIIPRNSELISAPSPNSSPLNKLLFRQWFVRGHPINHNFETRLVFELQVFYEIIRCGVDAYRIFQIFLMYLVFFSSWNVDTLFYLSRSCYDHGFNRGVSHVFWNHETSLVRWKLKFSYSYRVSRARLCTSRAVCRRIKKKKI